MIESERVFLSQSDVTCTLADTSKNIKEGENNKNDDINTVYSSFKDH